MNYNIVTVSNSTYYPFLQIFLRSLFENINLDNINKIYVYDSGLEEEQKEWVKTFQKVVIKDNLVKLETNTLHDEGWEGVTYSKLKCCLHALEETGKPSFIVDVDSVFEAEFIHLIDLSKDVVLCSCENRSLVVPGNSQFIGSFCGLIDLAKSREFVDEVYRIIPTINWPHKESPSITKAYAIKKEEIKFNIALEDQVSHIDQSTQKEFIAIYHLKSSTKYNTIQKRLIMHPWIKKYDK